MSEPELPPFTIRRSTRARHVRLQVSPIDGVVVVVPQGFDERRVPELLDTKRAWLKRKLSHVEHIERDVTPPDRIELKAIGETWPVVYRATNARNVSVRESAGELVLRGAIEDQARCRAALKRWLSRTAKLKLVPWLTRLSGEYALPFRKVTVRGQKTRWGSCSSQLNISMNYHLLLLDPELVNYVLIHELCHTRYLNHGRAFWCLVGELQPDHRRLHLRLKREWQNVPGWLARSD